MATLNLDPRRLAGTAIITALTHAGRVTLLVGESIRAIVEWRIWLPRAMTEAYNIGVGSLFIVIVVSAFTGAVTAFQAGYQFQTSLPIYIVGTLIVQSVILELGPVLTGLVLAGRVGARWAAELGTMRVTEQIDALESLGRSPISHLILPRIVAGLVMIPVLTVVSDVSASWPGSWPARTRSRSSPPPTSSSARGTTTGPSTGTTRSSRDSPSR